MSVGQTETDVGCPAGGVDTQLLPEPAEERENLPASGAHGTDGHNQGVYDHIGGWNSVVGGPLYDPFGHREANVRVLGDPSVVVGDSYYCGTMGGHQR